jgi:DNA-binding transcriptional ArsR family regulator
MEMVDSVFSALSHPTRRALLESVRDRPKSVAEIAKAFRVSRPAVSQHLRILENARLLRCQRSGRQHFYGLDLHGLNHLRSYVEHFWDDVLEAFQAAAISEDKDRKR